MFVIKVLWYQFPHNVIQPLVINEHLKERRDLKESNNLKDDVVGDRGIEQNEVSCLVDEPHTVQTIHKKRGGLCHITFKVPSFMTC